MMGRSRAPPCTAAAPIQRAASRWVRDPRTRRCNAERPRAQPVRSAARRAAWAPSRSHSRAAAPIPRAPRRRSRATAPKTAPPGLAASRGAARCASKACLAQNPCATWMPTAVRRFSAARAAHPRDRPAYRKGRPARRDHARGGRGRERDSTPSSLRTRRARLGLLQPRSTTRPRTEVRIPREGVRIGAREPLALNSQLVHQRPSLITGFTLFFRATRPRGMGGIPLRPRGRGPRTKGLSRWSERRPARSRDVPVPLSAMIESVATRMATERSSRE
jgi:hypothetical protein